MKKLFLYTFFSVTLILFCICNSFGQTAFSQPDYLHIKKKADSLLNQGMDDQKKGRFEAAIKSYQDGFEMYKIIKDMKGVGDCIIKTGNCYYLQGMYDKALATYDQVIDMFSKTGDQKMVAYAANNIGAIQYHLGYLTEALHYYQKALNIQKELDDQLIIASINANIGGIYHKIKDYENALRYMEDAFEIEQKIATPAQIAKSLVNIGIVHLSQKNFEKAFEYLNRSMKIGEETNDKLVLMSTIYVLGGLSFAQGDLKKSLEHYQQSLKLSRQLNSRQYISDNQIQIAGVFNLTGKYTEAIQNCKDALIIAESIGSLDLKIGSYEGLYKSYKSLGDDKTALIYLEKTRAFTDSLKTKEAANQILSMEFRNQQLTDSLSYVKNNHALELHHSKEIKRKENQRNFGIISLVFILIVAAGLWSRLNFVRRSRKAIRQEKDRSEQLLLNILPEEIARELKENGSVNAKDFEQVPILFSDFKSFTETAEKMTSYELVDEINTCFKTFDSIMEKYGLEKIKTIGDSYMAAGGIPVPDTKALPHIVLAGLEMQEFMHQRMRENLELGKPGFEMRVGIHVGPIVAGVVGVKKFQYDVWGDTVNTASRMESNGSPGEVNISDSVYTLLKDLDLFNFEQRGIMEVKGKGSMNMYFVQKKEIHMPALAPATLQN